MRNETLDEIKTSLENLCSFWNGSVWFELAESGPGRVVLLQLLSMYDGAVGVTNLGVTLLWLQRFSRAIVTMMTVEDVKVPNENLYHSMRDINLKIYHFKKSKHNHVS